VNIRFLRVLSVRACQPGVLAIVDGHRVRWRPGDGWSCDCPIEGDSCPHVDAVDALLDPRVLTPTTT